MKSKIDRRSVSLIKNLKVTKGNGIEVFFPIGTTFFNYRKGEQSMWDTWFYEYLISGGLGIKLNPEEFTETVEPTP